MTKTDTLFLLVNSMTKAEKRFLQLNIKTYGKNKDYQVLYSLLQSAKTDSETIKKSFRKLCPGASFDISCHHLYKLIVRNLIAFESGKDIENVLLKNFQECKILFRRSLFADCFNLVKKSKDLSLKHEHFSIFCMFARYELEVLNQLEFNGLSEEELIKRQSKLESVSRQQRTIDNHYSLYYVIRHRQLNQGPTRSESDKEKLNDLAFNELQANAGQVKKSFEANKIHLLFQSAYFSMTANPRSSLKINYELNELFEANKDLWASPPVYYLFHLQGILHNLRMFSQFGEMPYFIERAREITKTDPGAKDLVDHLVFIFQSYLLTDQQKYSEALKYLECSQETIARLRSNLPLASLAELSLQIALVQYKNKNFREATRELRSILGKGKPLQQLAVYSSIRLLLIMVHFDLHDFEFLSYEIRSFERELSRLPGSRQSELLTLKLIKKLINTSNREKQNRLIENTLVQLNELMDNPNENLRVRSLDLIGWINTSCKKQ